jgi:hypothetical protein
LFTSFQYFKYFNILYKLNIVFAVSPSPLRCSCSQQTDDTQNSVYSKGKTKNQSQVNTKIRLPALRSASWDVLVDDYDCPQGTRGCCCSGNRQDIVANDRFAFASSPRQTIYDLHGQMFVVEIKTVQLDSYSTGRQDRWSTGRQDRWSTGR